MSRKIQSPKSIRTPGILPLLLVLVFTGFSSAYAADGDQPTDKTAAKDSDNKSATETTEVTLSPDIIKRYGISIGKSTKQKLISHIVAPGEVSFNMQATAFCGCPVQGRVCQLKSNVGDVVKRGDELLVIESAELGESQSDYLQKRTATAAAEVAIDPAKSAYERAKSLYDSSRGIALTELQKREIDFKTAQSALLIAQSSLSAAENRLRLLGMDKIAIEKLVKSGEIDPHYSLRAPIAGTVTERLVTLGELVKPDSDKLAVVADMTSLWVLADVPENRAAELKTGAKAAINIGDQSYEGTVSFVGLSVDAANRSVPVRIEVKADPALKPGMFAQVDLTSRNGDEPVVTVPTSAIQSVDGSTAVFLPVDGKPGTFARQMVSVGDSANGVASIVSGLKGGEQVVVSGAFVLKAELGKASAKDND